MQSGRHKNRKNTFIALKVQGQEREGQEGEDQEEVDQKEVDQKEVDQEEVDQEEVDKEEVDKEQVDQKEEDHSEFVRGQEDVKDHQKEMGEGGGQIRGVICKEFSEIDP